MRTIALLFVGLVLFAQEPVKKPATIEELQAQVTQLEQAVAQKDVQIAQMNGYLQAEYVAFQKINGACFQSLAEAEQRAAGKK